MKKIVVAPDSFKGSLTSAEVADAVERESRMFSRSAMSSKPVWRTVAREP